LHAVYVWHHGGSGAPCHYSIPLNAYASGRSCVATRSIRTSCRRAPAFRRAGVATVLWRLAAPLHTTHLPPHRIPFAGCRRTSAPYLPRSCRATRGERRVSATFYLKGVHYRFASLTRRQPPSVHAIQNAADLHEEPTNRHSALLLYHMAGRLKSWAAGVGSLTLREARLADSAASAVLRLLPCDAAGIERPAGVSAQRRVITPATYFATYSSMAVMHDSTILSHTTPHACLHRYAHLSVPFTCHHLPAPHHRRTPFLPATAAHPTNLQPHPS